MTMDAWGSDSAVKPPRTRLFEGIVYGAVGTVCAMALVVWMATAIR